MEAFWFLLVAFFVGLLLYCIVQLAALSSRLRLLERQMQVLQRRDEGVLPSAETSRSPVVAEPSAAQVTPQKTPFPFPIPKAEMPPSRTREEWEALIGGKLLNRIGALALIIGAGFFLKYAFDNNWLNEIARVGIGTVTGIGLLIGAHKAKKGGFEIFSQGLLGAGIAILYLSAYATFNFYHLVSQPVAFLLMSVVTLAAFGEAFVADALSVALLGWLGGFLTPLLLSTGEANEIGLFTYIVLLDLGMLAVMYKKEHWNILHVLSLAATYFYYFAWYEQEYHSDAFGITLLFLSAFWGIFYATDLIDIELERTSIPWRRRIQRTVNGFLYALGLYLLFEASHDEWTGTALFILTFTYLLTTAAIHRGKPGSVWEIGQFTAGAALLLMTATGVQFERFAIVIAWTAEAFVLTYAGVRWRQQYLRYGGSFVFVCAALRLLGTHGGIRFEPTADFTLILNERFLSFLLLTAAAWGGAILIRGSHEKHAAAEADGLVFGGAFVLFLLLSFETADYFRLLKLGATSESHSSLDNLTQLSLSGVWLVYSMLLMAGGIWRRSSAPRRFAIGVFAFTILKIFIYDLSFLQTLYRIFSFLGLGIILLGVSYLYQKYKDVILGTDR